MLFLFYKSRLLVKRLIENTSGKPIGKYTYQNSVGKIDIDLGILINGVLIVTKDERRRCYLMSQCFQESSSADAS